jgi:hypothetical protein
MKSKTTLLILSLSLVFTCTAQSFRQGDKFLKVGLGTSSFFHQFTNKDLSQIYKFSRYRPYTALLNVESEFAVHKFVGVGCSFSAGGKPSGGVGYLSTSYSPELNIAVGVFSNFHFLQLITQKVGKENISDKLDIYVGLSVGTGVALFAPFKDHAFASLFFVGPHIGFRYFFKPNLAINGEAGYGKTITHIGLIFKLNKK